MRKLVYISGPITASSAVEMLENIGTFSRIEHLLLKSGFAPVNPANDFLLCVQGNLSKEELLEKDKAIISVCDAIFTLDGWAESEGALKELEWARHAGIPIVSTLSELHNLFTSPVDWVDELPEDPD
jgi:hypothetical protein